MLERHHEAPDSLETPNAPVEINWEGLRDAPLVGINGTIDWNQIERERILGAEAEYTWTDDDDDESESLNENEVHDYDDYGEQFYDNLLDEDFDVIEWIPYEIGDDEFLAMMEVD